MIRGILLLILSCVVLTLQSCTCEQNAKPSVCEKANDIYPAPSAYGIDFTQKPGGDTAELATCFNKIASRNLLKETTTAAIQKMEDDGKVMLSAVSLAVEGLLATKAAVLRDFAWINVTIDSDCQNLYDLVDVIDCPVVAVDHCLKSLYIESRRLSLKKTIKYLDVLISAKVNLKALYVQYLSVVSIAIGLSRTVDDLLSKCILGPLLCKRDGIVSNLATTLTSTLTTALTSLGSALNNYNLEINAKITADPTLYLALTDIDVKHTVLRAHLNEIWGIIERVGGCTFLDLQHILAELLHNVDNIIWLIKGLFYRFTLGPTTQFICTGYNDPSSRLISCTLTSKIVADVSVSVGGVVNIDITIAVKLANICRTIFMGLTGGNHVETKVLSLAGDGTCVIEILFKREYHELIETVYQVPEVINVCGIEQILLGGQVNGIILSTLDRIQQEGALTTITNTLGGIVSEVIDVTSNALTTITHWTNGLVHRSSLLTTALNAILISTERIEIAQLTFDRCVASENEKLEVLRTLLPTCESSKKQAEIKVAACELAMVKARLELEQRPNDPIYSERYAKCYQSYMESLRLAVQVQVQANLIHDTIKAKIELDTGVLASLLVDLQLNLDGIISGVLKAIAALRVDIQLKIDLYISRIIACIKAFRPTCGIISIDFLNLSVTTDANIRVSITIHDKVLPGEQLETMRECHRALVRAAAILCFGSNVEVEAGPLTIGLQEFKYIAVVS